MKTLAEEARTFDLFEVEGDDLNDGAARGYDLLRRCADDIEKKDKVINKLGIVNGMIEPCVVYTVSSRMCSRGTFCCVIIHDNQVIEL